MMSQEPEEQDNPQTEKAQEAPTCPLCRSPLIGEAIKSGKCQCCGHEFDVDVVNT